MSFKSLAWAWEQVTGSPGRKAVLGALAQFADEHGVCYPSQATIARHTEQSTRTVREHLNKLEADGFITRIARTGADGGNISDLYQLNMTARKAQQPPAEDFAAPPAENLAAPCGEIRQTPAAKSAAKPVVNKQSTTCQVVKEQPARAARDVPAAAGQPVSKDITAAELVAAGVDEQVAADFIAHRKQQKAPLTQTALAGLRREADKAGWSLSDALAECVMRGWRGFKAEWLQERPRPASAINAREASRLAACRAIGLVPPLSDPFALESRTFDGEVRP